MINVIKFKKKHRLPIVNSDSKNEKQRRELREKELQDQLSDDLDSGRLKFGRRYPIFDENNQS